MVSDNEHAFEKKAGQCRQCSSYLQMKDLSGEERYDDCNVEYDALYFYPLLGYRARRELTVKASTPMAAAANPKRTGVGDGK